MGITNCLKLIPVQYFILLQLIVFLPLALIRDLAKLSTTALIADAFILVGLLYIFGSEISIVMERGIADVKLFNPRDFPLFIGYVASVLIYIFDLIIYEERLSFLSKESVWYVNPAFLLDNAVERILGYSHNGRHARATQVP